MNIPLFILIGLFCISLGINIAKHGEPKNEKYNVWNTFLNWIIQLALTIWAIYAGGGIL